MELFEVEVRTCRSLTLPWAEAVIMPVGDIQYGSEACVFDKFKRHMEWGMKHNAYFIGCGDFLDVASPSGRQKIRHADFYDSVTDALEDKVREQLDKFYTAVKGTEGRWLGLVHGHHYYEFSNGTTTDTILAERLRCPYLGTSGIVQLKFKGNKHLQTAQIFVHHGQGSGVTMTAPLNKLERMMSRFPSVDIFILGHFSRKVAYPVDALVPVFGARPKLVAKRRILACTGGFSKGYVVGSGIKRYGKPRGSYVEEGLYPPTNLGGLVIRVRPVRSGDENRIDLSVEQ